ncbi:MAG: hypothetical protein P8Y14_04800 [Anaerolineales bacterium]|jgi:hypothetical protein
MMDIRKLLQKILDPWVLLGAIGFAVVLLSATLFLLWKTRSTTVANAMPTAALTIVSLPTATPLTPTPTTAPPETPTPTIPSQGPSGDLAVGAYVQITGTGGDGLRLRTGPGLSNQVRLLGLESEVFEVRDGPEEADGYTWWYLVAPFDESRAGWAVAGYLAVVQNP